MTGVGVWDHTSDDRPIYIAECGECDWWTKSPNRVYVGDQFDNHRASHNTAAGVASWR